MMAADDTSRPGRRPASPSAASDVTAARLPAFSDLQNVQLAHLLSTINKYDDDDDSGSVMIEKSAISSSDVAARTLLNVQVKGLRLTLRSQFKSELIYVRLANIAMQLVMGFGRVHLIGSLGTLHVLDRSAPLGSLARTLVQLGSNDSPKEDAHFVGAEPAVEFDWANLPSERAEAAKLSVRVSAAMQLVFAPLLVAKFESFTAAISEVQEVAMHQQVQVDMKRLLRQGMGGRQHMLAEKVAYRQQNQMALDVRVDKARLLLSRELTKSNTSVISVELGELGVRSAPIHDELEEVASPEVAAAVAAASLSAQIPDSELRDVHSALYSKVRVHLSELNINVYARPTDAIRAWEPEDPDAHSAAEAEVARRTSCAVRAAYSSDSSVPARNPCHAHLPPPPLPRTIASAAPPSAAWPIGCSHLCSLTPSSAPWTIGAA